MAYHATAYAVLSWGRDRRKKPHSGREQLKEPNVIQQGLEDINPL